MKVYKKCEPCKSDGLILCGEELQPCENCNGVGYIETEIPVEQALEALKGVEEDTDLFGGKKTTWALVIVTIKALEEAIK